MSNKYEGPFSHKLKLDNGNSNVPSGIKQCLGAANTPIQSLGKVCRQVKAKDKWDDEQIFCEKKKKKDGNEENEEKKRKVGTMDNSNKTKKGTAEVSEVIAQKPWPVKEATNQELDERRGSKYFRRTSLLHSIMQEQKRHSVSLATIATNTTAAITTTTITTSATNQKKEIYDQDKRILSGFQNPFFFFPLLKKKTKTGDTQTPPLPELCDRRSKKNRFNNRHDGKCFLLFVVEERKKGR
ncbi:hypothetical protein RFI_11580 [Reticulomyxa filosa]|uniref:Uncharacterized protein n=1 Tax=Reticulomyxa filosa TaxID=46433 RepID=X6NJM5_RETFI|nr:hypothetical protein RFI_11580 [Reticulomyxa filosa]|eukprot:ETO25557.1 hypothetical protein RFI_11580 [Reticulomyxa filosa]